MAECTKKVLYYNIDEKFLTPYVSMVEKSLLSNGHIDLEKTDTLRGARADLIVVSSPLGAEELIRWIKRLIEDLDSNSIWTPMLFLVDISLSDIEDMVWECISNTNWYFDIVTRDNLDFLSMRIAMLLKISDHIKEIKGYDDKIKELSSKVLELEAKLKY